MNGRQIKEAHDQGRAALAMPVVIRKRRQFAVGSTDRLGAFNIQSVRLMDMGPQSAYTAMQNQIEALQSQQQQLLEAAFEQGPEITLEHLEAVKAAGERAVERLNAEAQ